MLTRLSVCFLQHLKTLQRKLEEQEEALLGRAQVVDFLQQELRGAEQQSQVLPRVLPAADSLLWCRHLVWSLAALTAPCC